MVRKTGIAVIKKHKPTVAGFGLSPRYIPVVEIRPIILKPGQHGVVAGGMRPNTLNLPDTERIIQGGEGRASSTDALQAELEDAAIVTHIDSISVRIQCQRMLVGVYPALLRKKCPVGS